MITKILVTVTTYPTLSERHYETVCTAGFREDGSWIRIYPVPHRLLWSLRKAPYKKWQWIEADIEKNPRDSRPESYKIRDIDTLRIGEMLSNSRPVDWSLRYQWLTKNKHVYDNMEELITLAHKNELSLAVLKPVEITDFIIDPITDMESHEKKLMDLKKKYDAEKSQLSLFDEDTSDRDFEFAKLIPYRFKYEFRTADNKVRRLMIEDWEIGMLYLNCLDSYPENIALEKVKEKYMEFVRKKDVHLLVGTQFRYHMMKSPDPFVIIGVFPAPRNVQLRLDF